MNLSLSPQKRRFLLAFPLLIFPFCCLVFFNLGGGAGATPQNKPALAGLNVQLPSPALDPTRAFENKIKAYQQADNDSARKAQFQRQDPYHHDTSASQSTQTTQLTAPTIKLSPQHLSPSPAAPDDRAARLLQRLAHLQQAVHQNNPPPARTPLWASEEIPSAKIPMSPTTFPSSDPQISRLDALLDKVIRIQHPLENSPQPPPLPSPVTDKIEPADSTANTLAATIPESQVITSGATLAIRITDSIRINGQTIPPGQLVFGTTSISNDRLIIHITTLRESNNLYTVDWQAYDLDGLPGIHIPSLLSRDVAKQSADQGIGSLNILSTDPSLGAQAAGAGIQAAKSLFSHKVRQIRVTIPSGYRILLRNSHQPHHQPPTTTAPKQSILLPQPPDFDPVSGKLAKSHTGGIQLTLRTLLIRDTCLWFGLEWINHSSIPFHPTYARWWIRSRKALKRTAFQDESIHPLVFPPLPVLSRDSTHYSWIGFKPFALTKDKQLMLEIGEEGGQRILTLTISSDQILNAKIDETTGKE